MPDLPALPELPDGAEFHGISITVHIDVQKRATGEVDKNFNEVRERLVSETELEELFLGSDWHYEGCIDAMNDFMDRDKLELYVSEP